MVGYNSLVRKPNPRKRPMPEIKNKDLDVVLVVEDENPVRRTLLEWLEGANLGIRVLAAEDAASALQIASQNPVDLAILDWNLGAGLNGLDLLEDMFLFQPEVVAILVTGFANQATPLHAMRIGVRDYLDKAQDLTREKFLSAVSRQLDRLRPAKNQRKILRFLESFQQTVAVIVSCIDSKNALEDPATGARQIRELAQVAAGIFQATGAVIYLIEENGDKAECHYWPNENKSPQMVDYSSTYAAMAPAHSGELLRINLQGSPDKLARVKNPLETRSANAWFVSLKHGEKMVGVLELLDPSLPEEQIRAQLISVGCLLGEVVFKSKLVVHTRNVLQDALGKAIGLQADLATGNPLLKPAQAFTDVIQSMGLTPDQLALLQEIQSLSRKAGVDAIQTCTAIVQKVSSLMSKSMGEES